MMDLPLALHTAARRFCAAQHYLWATEYRPLLDSGQDRVGMGYSTAAYKLFPRYRLDEAIQIEVERSTGMEFNSTEEAQALLLDAGRRALSALLREFQDSKDACVALNDEYMAFEQYIAGMGATELGRVEPLPYRRVLGEPESERLWDELRARWGVTGYWYPLADCDPHTNVLAFHQELWEQRRGTSLLLQAVQARALQRCFLLREEPPDYEIDSSLMNPIYRGDECFVTTDFEWLLYISHESSLTVAGWLADFFRAKWPDWGSITYGGPFHTADLRGSWGTLKR